jgi:hypothetical protein
LPSIDEHIRVRRQPLGQQNTLPPFVTNNRQNPVTTLTLQRQMSDTITDQTLFLLGAGFVLGGVFA